MTHTIGKPLGLRSFNSSPTASQLAKATLSWLRDYGFAPSVELTTSASGKYTVSYEVRTTKTRASHEVSRIKLIVRELARGREFFVSKELIDVRPMRREDLSTWKILVEVPGGRTLRVRQATSSSGILQIP